MNAPESRDGISHRVVFIALGISVVMALLLSFYVYERYVRYVPRVAQHMGTRPALALRLDVEQAVVYEPFRRHLLPLLEARRPPDPEGGQRSISRLDALREKTTIELGVDLREFGITVDRSGRWAVLLGGHFRRDGVAVGVGELLQREGVAAVVRSAPERLVHESGIALAAAEDGVLVLAQSEELLLSLLGPTSGGPAFEQGLALALRMGAEGTSPLDAAELDVHPGQTFETELRMPGVAASLSDADVVGLIGGKTGDFKLLHGIDGWTIQRSAGRPERALTQLSREEFDLVIARIARGLGVLMGLEAP